MAEAEKFVVVKLGAKTLRLVDLPVGTVIDIARQHAEQLSTPAMLTGRPGWWLVVNQPIQHDLGVGMSVLTEAARILGESLPNPFTIDSMVDCFDVEESDLPDVPEMNGEAKLDPTNGVMASTPG